jgi:predicted Zn finger-like uncharacterized protein
MFTVCPKCALTLVVTAADLRVAQGYVRCGRCSSVFNALARLAEERQTAEAPAPSSPPPAPSPPPPEPPAPAPASVAREPAPPAPERRSAAAATRPAAAPGTTARAPAPADEEAIPEDALEFNAATTDAASVFVEPPPSPEWTAATGSFKAMLAANEESGPAPAQDEAQPVDVELDAQLLSDIMREEPVAPPPAPPPATPARSPAPAEASSATAAAAPRGATHARPATAAAAAHSPPRTAQQPPPPAAPEAPPEPQAARAAETMAAALSREAPAAAAREPGNLLWTLGAAVLALTLGAQYVNHHRDLLATDPRFNRPLSAVYRALGVTLTPRWDLHAYDVRQLGASVSPGSVGTITVRASVHNAGPRQQPLPLLRVTLQDRFGTPLASRDVQPAEYLRRVPPGALLASDERVDAEMAFVDPGSNAVGFELDACLPRRGGGVACANDLGSR